jgi:signal transduction histidine kinase
MMIRRVAHDPPGMARAAALRDRAPLALRGGWLWAGRAAWLLVAAAAVGLAIIHLPRHFTNADDFSGIGAPQSATVRAGLRRLGIAPVVYSVYRVGLDQLAALVNLAVAALLMRRKSSEGVVVLIAILLTAGVAANDPPSLIALSASHPLQAALGKILTLTRMTLLVAMFFVFPDGRLIPRWGIVPIGLWFAQVGAILFFHGSALDSWNWPALPTALSFALIFIPAIYAQVHRYRAVSGPVARQQTKWAIGGLLIAILGFAALNVWLAAEQNRWSTSSPVRALAADFAFDTLFTLAFAAIPITMAVAIFKHRLFAIDLILNRALVYGLLSASVIAIYAAVVGAAGALFRAGGSLPVSLAGTVVVALLFQPLRERLQRGANRLLYGERDEPYAVVARLGRRLETSAAPVALLPSIVETVAQALKLPYAAIALGPSGAAAVAAEHGVAPAAPLTRVPLIHQNDVVGELRLAPRAGEAALSDGDRRLLAGIAPQTGIAIHALRLSGDLQQARERLVTAREEERRRLRRDLHDGLGPRLAALTLRLDTARALTAGDEPARDLFDDLAARMEEAVAEIRRLVAALRPAALDDLGLAGALRQAAESYGPDGPAFEVWATDDGETGLRGLPAALEVAAYRIALEAMTNVVRHAGAAHCLIRVARRPDAGVVELEVSDDGRGMGAAWREGIGLGSMRERAEELGGTCVVGPAPGGGTRVFARLPDRPREGAA